MESGGEVEALKAVDEESGEIAGYAVWGWTARVSSISRWRIPCFVVGFESVMVVIFFLLFLYKILGKKVGYCELARTFHILGLS